MPKAITTYVRWVDAVSRVVGRFAMYMIFAMMGLLLFSSISRSVFSSNHIWVVEMAQFMMAAYYLLGGGYSMRLDGHVRMDLLYSMWSPRGRAIADVITSVFLVFFLVVLIIGGYSSIEYSLATDQRNYSSWAPPVAPIKIIMTFGIVLMLLQAIATFFRDVATVRGRPIP